MIELVMLSGELIEQLVIKRVVLRGERGKVTVKLAHGLFLALAQCSGQRVVRGVKGLMRCLERGLKRFTGRGLPIEESVQRRQELLMQCHVRRANISRRTAGR